MCFLEVCPVVWVGDFSHNFLHLFIAAELIEPPGPILKPAKGDGAPFYIDCRKKYTKLIKSGHWIGKHSRVLQFPLSCVNGTRTEAFNLTDITNNHKIVSTSVQARF